MEPEVKEEGKEYKPSQYDELMADLKKHREALKVKIDLSKQAAKDEWEELEAKFDTFTQKAEEAKNKTATSAREAKEEYRKTCSNLADEIRGGYERIKEKF